MKHRRAVSVESRADEAFYPPVRVVACLCATAGKKEQKLEEEECRNWK